MSEEINKSESESESSSLSNENSSQDNPNRVLGSQSDSLTSNSERLEDQGSSVSQSVNQAS